MSFQELVAYESLWADKNATFKSIFELFTQYPDRPLSDFAQCDQIPAVTEYLRQTLLHNPNKINLLLNGAPDFPAGLKDARHPVPLLYYTGALEYLHMRRIAVIGTRHPTPAGLEATAYLVAGLVNDDIAITSGLAAGIDTQAHTTAIRSKGRTIAVLGTPLNTVYPKENAPLQQTIAREHLLISQVPFYRYSRQDYRVNRLFFLERNKTMSALTAATLIVEAGETSGTLTQAAAALYQKRKLFIWDTCFYNKALTWPKKMLAKGAVRIRSYHDLKKALD